MAEYTNLPDSAVGRFGAPTGTTVTALRDNPIAISEGAAGAPRIQTAAIQNLAVTTDKIANGSVTPEKLSFTQQGPAFSTRVNRDINVTYTAPSDRPIWVSAKLLSGGSAVRIILQIDFGSGLEAVARCDANDNQGEVYAAMMVPQGASWRADAGSASNQATYTVWEQN